MGGVSGVKLGPSIDREGKSAGSHEECRGKSKTEIRLGGLYKKARRKKKDRRTSGEKKIGKFREGCHTLARGGGAIQIGKFL